jgi:hypothetical protein
VGGLVEAEDKPKPATENNRQKSVVQREKCKDREQFLKRNE